MTRRRFVYRLNSETGQVESHEVGTDYAPQDVRVPVATDLYMSGVRATDGTDISSRAKRKEWMKRNDLVDVSDCTGMWAKAEKARAEVFQGRNDTSARREEVQRAIYRLSQK